MTRHVVVDTSGPTATDIWPLANMRMRGKFTSTIKGVQDGAGVASAELWVNGMYMGTDTTAPYSVVVDTGISSGTLALDWRLTDSFGNQSSYKRNVIAVK